MKIRAFAAVTAAITALSTLAAYAENAETEGYEPMQIIIDGNNANTKENMLYRGTGMVSANNSSRLLLDYKAENPQAYDEIMNYIFGKDGLEIAHLKLEMGSDINSSSGTEPSVMRYENQAADVTRGAGFQIAADAKAINPNLTLDMLWWSEPLWITNSDDVYAARYKWYKQTLDAAYEVYGLEFDYVSATQNERKRDNEWIKYLSEHLKSEKDTPYDYSKIKIVAGDEVCTWSAASDLLKDIEAGGTQLSGAIDVIGSHYTSKSSDAAKELAEKYGKELWFSEGSSSMSYAQGAWRFDEGNSGLTGINGALDIANRFIAMYPNGKMTLCQFQPIVAAYYDGVCYCQKQFINACDPWSGYYTLDSGFFVMLHFTQFMDRGWSFVDEACYCDAKVGGDGHALVNAVYSYLTTCSPDNSDYSTVITNTTDKPITYNFTVKNLKNAGNPVYLWETIGPDGTEYDENYLRHIDTVTPQESDGEYTYSVTVKPYSIITLSTVEYERKPYENKPESERTILELPYTDDFEYSDYPDSYLESRGNAPRYTTDQGGAFEAENGRLLQKITPDIKAKEWGGTPNPVTSLGDDRWYNYSVSADIFFEKSDDEEKNYAGVGLRYNQGHMGESGYWLKLCENGKWSLMRNSIAVQSGTAEFDGSNPVKLKIEASYDNIKCYADSKLICDYTAQNEEIIGAGRAALYSSYNKNAFDNLEIMPLENIPTYITRYDNTDLAFEYEGEWNHNTMSSFKNYKRTISEAQAGASLTVSFDGTGIAFTGGGKGCTVKYSVDGGEYTEYLVPKTDTRGVGLMINGLENSSHTVSVSVVDGTFSFDGAELSGGKVHTAKQPVHSESELTSDNESSEPTSSEPISGSDTQSTGSDSGKNEVGNSLIPVIIGGAVLAAGATAAAVITAKKRKNKKNK